MRTQKSLFLCSIFAGVYFNIYLQKEKKINIMAMFLGSLVVIGVFVVIEIIGNAIKNTEDSENEKGN